MKIVVCGSRNAKDIDAVWRELDALAPQPTFVACGDAWGVDNATILWCFKRGISHAQFNALWSFHGKASGPLRNQAMLDVVKPDLVVAFPGGKGTADCVKRAETLGIQVKRLGQ